MAQPVLLDDVAAALRPAGHELISLVGGGGKSTLLFALGRGLRGDVILTTTTRMGARQTDGLTPLVGASDDEIVDELHRRHRILVWDRIAPGQGRDPGKAVGPSPARVDRWFDEASYVVVEADGARHLPFKAPASHEPRLPSRSSLTVAVIGADALGRCIGDQCFRPLRVAAVAGCGPYDRLTPERAARVLTSDRGSRKGVPESARFVVAITKVGATDHELVDDTAARIEARGIEVVRVAHHG